MRSLWKEEVPIPKLLNRNYLRLLQGLDKELVRQEWDKYNNIYHKLIDIYINYIIIIQEGILKIGQIISMKMKIKYTNFHSNTIITIH